MLAVSQIATRNGGSAGNLSSSGNFSGRYSTLRALELENEGQLDMAAASYEHNLAHWEFASTPQSVPFNGQHNSSMNSDTVDVGSIQDQQRLVLYAGLFRCELSDPARLHGLVERAGALIRRHRPNGLVKTPELSTTTPDSNKDVTDKVVSTAWIRRLNAYRAEAAWRLSDWSTLRETTHLVSSTSFHHYISIITLAPEVPFPYFLSLFDSSSCSSFRPFSFVFATNDPTGQRRAIQFLFYLARITVDRWLVGLTVYNLAIFVV